MVWPFPLNDIFQEDLANKSRGGKSCSDGEAGNGKLTVAIEVTNSEERGRYAGNWREGGVGDKYHRPIEPGSMLSPMIDRSEEVLVKVSRRMLLLHIGKLRPQRKAGAGVDD